MGPFLPQRFAPPNYAWGHAARCYKQKTIEEVGRALYGPSGEPLDALAEPTADQALVSDKVKDSEGSALWRAKREEFGLAKEAQTADNIWGQVPEEAKPESSQPPQDRRHAGDQRGKDHQPNKGQKWQSGSQWWATAHGTPSSSSWWQSAGQEWEAYAGDSATMWSSQPTGMTPGTSWTERGSDIFDQRGLKVFKYYASGKERQ